MPLDKLFSSVKAYLAENYIDPDICQKYARRIVEPNTKILVQELDSDKTYSGQAEGTRPRAAEKSRLEHIVGHLDETFSQALLRKIDDRGLKDSDVYHRANIDRRLFSKIRSDSGYRPGKSTAVSLALALRLNLDETKDLLLRAGFALSNSSKSDVIIQYFIENKNFNIYEINEVLLHFGEKEL